MTQNSCPQLSRTNGIETGTKKSLYQGEYLDLVSCEINFAKSERIVLRTHGEASLTVAISGVLAFPVEPGLNGHRVISPGSVSLLGPNIELAGLATAGKLKWQILTWRKGALPAVDRVLAMSSQRSRRACLNTVPAAGLSQDPLRTFATAPGHGFPRADLELLACVMALIPELLEATNRIAIAPIPHDLPAPVQQLVGEVTADPSLRWPLSEAATRAGYSSFHFSRMFKQLVGCGFHEFVDRCRTELAVVLLSSPDALPTEAWAESGFPSLRAMRESIRDYLGLSIADLRRLSERNF